MAASGVRCAVDRILQHFAPSRVSQSCLRNACTNSANTTGPQSSIRTAFVGQRATSNCNLSVPDYLPSHRRSTYTEARVRNTALNTDTHKDTRVARPVAACTSLPLAQRSGSFEVATTGLALPCCRGRVQHHTSTSRHLVPFIDGQGAPRFPSFI